MIFEGSCETGERSNGCWKLYIYIYFYLRDFFQYTGICHICILYANYIFNYKLNNYKKFTYTYNICLNYIQFIDICVYLCLYMCYCVLFMVVNKKMEWMKTMKDVFWWNVVVTASTSRDKLASILANISSLVCPGLLMWQCVSVQVMLLS